MDSCISEKDRSCYEHVIRTYKRRCRSRSLLSQHEKDDLDSQLSRAIKRFIWNPSDRYSAKISTARHIVRLISLGGTASKLPLQCWQSNVACMMEGFLTASYNFMETPGNETYESRLFYILSNLVVSSCDSWYKQKYVDGNNHLHLVEAIFSLTLSGGAYSLYHFASIKTRYRAWSLYKKMVWVTEYANSGRGFNGLIPFESSHGVYSNNLQSAFQEVATLSNGECNMNLGVEFANFFRPRSFVRRLDIATGNEFFDYEGLPIAANRTGCRMTEIMRGTPFFHRYKHELSAKLNPFFASPAKRKELVSIINDKSMPEIFYGEHFIKELCRRRERKMLMHLVKSDERKARRIVTIALEMLQSAKVRGRKEKMIQILLLKQRDSNLNRLVIQDKILQV